MCRFLHRNVCFTEPEDIPGRLEHFQCLCISCGILSLVYHNGRKASTNLVLSVVEVEEAVAGACQRSLVVEAGS